jgi:glutamate carboxypeptidase
VTVNLARVAGGDRGFVEAPNEYAALLGSGRQLNVVAERAAVEGEFRFLAPADGEAVRERLVRLTREIAEAGGVRAELVFGHEVAPVDATAERLAVAERAVDCAARRGWRLEVERDRGGISFPNFLPAELALPILDGLGPAGGGMHTRDEHVDVVSFARRLVLVADLLEVELSAA